MPKDVDGNRVHRPSFRRFALIALGSADETLLWCRFAKDLGYFDMETFERLHASYTEIAKMLNSLISRLK